MQPVLLSGKIQLLKHQLHSTVHSSCPLIQYPLLLPFPVNVTGSCWSFCLPLQHLRQGLCVFVPHLSQVMQNLARLLIHWVQHMGSGLSKLLQYPVAHIISWRIPLPLNAPCQAWKTGRVSRCSSYSPVQWTTKSYTQTALLQQVLVCLSGLSVSTDQDFTSAIQVLPLTVRLKQQTYANQLKLYTMHSRYSLRAQLCWNPQRREGGREGGRKGGREGGRNVKASAALQLLFSRTTFQSFQLLSAHSSVIYDIHPSYRTDSVVRLLSLSFPISQHSDENSRKGCLLQKVFCRVQIHFDWHVLLLDRQSWSNRESRETWGTNFA